MIEDLSFVAQREYVGQIDMAAGNECRTALSNCFLYVCQQKLKTLYILKKSNFLFSPGFLGLKSGRLR
jgi:hypothetical protein